MSFGKIVCKIIQSLPSWEMTKYYGRVCLFQLNCIKYRIQTSEAWFHFKYKYMPHRIQYVEKKENPKKLTSGKKSKPKSKKIKKKK